MTDTPRTYELWDRQSGNMVMDFATWEEAMEFVRGEIDGLNEAERDLRTDRLALLRVEGGKSEVRTQGIELGLLALITPPKADR